MDHAPRFGGAHRRAARRADVDALVAGACGASRSPTSSCPRTGQANTRFDSRSAIARPIGPGGWMAPGESSAASAIDLVAGGGARSGIRERVPTDTSVTSSTSFARITIASTGTP